jgi:hypothetical protein
MDEKGANFGGVVLWIEQGSLPAGPLVSAIERFSLAPAAAAYDERGRAEWLRGRVARDHT